MAIKGDIDLTTNCDFRHDREDKIKRLESSKRVPWHSKINSRIHYIKNRHYDVNSIVINRDLTNQIRIGDVSIVNNPSYELRYNHTANTISIVYTGISPDAAEEVTDSILNNEDNLSWSTTVRNIRVWNDDTDTTSIYYDGIIDTRWDDHHEYPWKNKRDEEEKNPKEYIKTKCYDCGKEYYDIFNSHNRGTCPRCAFIKRFGDRNLLKGHPVLPWEEDKDFNSRTYWDYWHRRRYNTPWIPGEEEEDDSKFTVEDIPWIKAIDSYRKREDYIKDLYEEQDYSKYLTNMGWIGLH